MPKLLLAVFCTFLFVHLDGQKSAVKGSVKDSEGNVVIGANVSATPGNTGTITDINGDFFLGLDPGSYTISASYIGLASRSISITLKTGENYVWNVTLEEDAIKLDDVILVGTRSTPRSSTTSPLPVDIFTSKDLVATGQNSFDKALQYRVPSFNTVQTPVNDATSLLDPYELRNMGPSRTLILINGKRKNNSALVYTQTAPGRGETGADLSAIPTDAIKRVEILRDGASAQYGSDAIAGVMNVILKDRFDYGSVTLNTGVTHKGDGKTYGISLNNGANFGEKGYLNYTAAFSQVGLANRAGLLNAADEAEYWGVSLEETKKFLDKYPDGRHINGSPMTTAAKFLINGGLPVSTASELYFNAAYVYKRVNSYANHRAPYWIDTDYGLLTPPGQPYTGYTPTFDGDLNDYNATVGLKSEKNGWKTDLSFTTGGNNQIYSVVNTLNLSLGANSPVEFKPGGYKFQHNVGNIDISKALSDNVSFAVGSEFRVENFTILAGDEASYIKGPLDAPAGANSYPGTTPENAGLFTRYNVGGYVDLGWDITRDFMINGTARVENYSDFGDAFVWKVSSRYKLNDDRITLRASASTGFRAPTLHQIYMQATQASYIDGTVKETGIFRNGSSQIRQLGVPKLKAEESFNFTAGLGLKPVSDLNITIDYYNIRVDDRIVLSSVIGPGDDATAAALNKILSDNALAAIQFFTNGVNTRTSGIDMVLNYKGLEINDKKLGINLAGNYTLENKLLSVQNPSIITAAGKSIFDQTQEALMLTSRPKYKAIFGLDYMIGKVGLNLNNTLFGPTKFRQADLSSTTDLETQFLTKLVTDLGITYNATSKTTVSLNINNLLNVLPQYKVVGLTPDGQAIVNDPAQLKTEIANITFDGRYPVTTYDGSHFSQLGTLFSLSVNLRL
jgi:iron complex outermembrane receptor protein